MSPLYGVDLLGCIYDVNGRYGKIDSVKSATQLFDLPKKNRTIFLHGHEFEYSECMTATCVGYSRYEEKETLETNELSKDFKISIAVSGSYGLFAGELSARYDSEYYSNQHFLHVRRYGYTREYQVALPSIDALQSALKKEVGDDLNSTSMDPRRLIDKYGCYFLNSAIFGGEWQYTQSVSKFEFRDKKSAEAHVEANYSTFLKGSVGTSSAVENRGTISESNAHWQAFGGYPETLRLGYDAWAKTVRENNYAMIDFIDQKSILPISILAISRPRQVEIDREINRRMERGEREETSLGYETAGLIEDGRGRTDLSYKAMNESEVLVGFGATVDGDDGRVVRMAVRVLNLVSNEYVWRIVRGSNVSSFNRSDYELIFPSNSLDESRVTGSVLTGVKLRADGGSLANMELIYHRLDPAGFESRRFLGKDETIISRPETTGPHIRWDRKIDTAGERVLIGVGLSYHSDGWLPRLEGDTAKLKLAKNS